MLSCDALRHRTSTTKTFTDRFQALSQVDIKMSLATARTPNRRLYATVTDLQKYPKPGDQLHGFTLKRSKHFPELELSALELQHDETGAQYLHVARDDSNNVFSIGFKTNPPDATGVPHILEHTTLCGSEKWVKDPANGNTLYLSLTL